MTNHTQAPEGGVRLKPHLFSIVIDNYNYAEFLPQAIDSCLCQTYPVHEIIIVDDGSTDNSREVLQSYHGIKNVKIVLQENQGQEAALQHGFDQATGDWILGLDSDDYYHPNCLEEIAKRLDGKVDWVYFRAAKVDVNGNRIGTTLDPKTSLMEGEVWIPWILHGQFHTFPPQSFHCRSTKFIRTVKLFPNRFVNQKLAITPDRYLDLLSSFACHAGAIDAELGCYRDHFNSFTGVSQRAFHRIRTRLRQQILAEEIIAEKLLAKGVSPPPSFYSYSANEYWPDRLISLVYDRSGHPHPEDTRLRLLLRILSNYTKGGRIRILGLARAFIQYSAVAVMPRELAWRIYKLPRPRKVYAKVLTQLRARTAVTPL